MIKIKEKQLCVGCNACNQICPKNCIRVIEDQEGFLYPNVDIQSCIDCGMCEKVCPVIHQNAEKIKDPICYAVKNKNEETRQNSSSGGVFTELAEYVLNRNGVVFGARFDKNWNVIHDYTENIYDLSEFRGSKYVQSQINYNYQIAKKFLDNNRIVLFSGTPCQIAGLKRFLKKEYLNLYTVDFVCHGVPSPKVWRLYIQELLNTTKRIKNQNNPVLKKISFRDKTYGWKTFSFKASISLPNDDITLIETLKINIFMKGFLNNLFLRPSCHYCPSKNFKSGSNFTIADFWGINNFYKNFDDDKGISLVMVSDELLIKKFLNNVKLIKTTFPESYKYNPTIFESVRANKNRTTFFKYIDKKNIVQNINKYTKPSIYTVITMYITNIINKIITYSKLKYFI